MYYLESGYGIHNRMRNAVLLAVALHAVLLLGVSFRSGSDTYQAPQLEITLATKPDDTAPEQAQHLAQANQQGSGDPAEAARLSSQNNQITNEGEAGPQALLQPQDTVNDTPRDTVTSAATQRAVFSEPLEQEQAQLPVPGISPEVDKLTRELANLEAELDVHNRNYAQMPRVRRLTSVATRQAVDAAYLLDWRRRVEAVGNKYYPEASVRYGIYGNLRLLVAIRADGNLQGIEVLSSSGYAVLDEAAIKIVRMAAPFAPFPDELRATTDQLEIIRTWQFQENRLSSQ